MARVKCKNSKFKNLRSPRVFSIENSHTRDRRDPETREHTNSDVTPRIYRGKWSKTAISRFGVPLI